MTAESFDAASLKALLESKLPPENLCVLRFVIRLLVDVSHHESSNKMSSTNLAIVFGPNLIWSSAATATLASVGQASKLTAELINHADEIFGPASQP